MMELRFPAFAGAISASAGQLSGLLAVTALACALALGLGGVQIAFADDQLAAGEAGVTDTAGSDTASSDSAQQKSTSKYTTVARVTLDKKTAKIKNAQTAQFEATLVPADPEKKLKKKDQQITWAVSNPTVARITQDGVVQAKKTGTVKVVAMSANGKKAKATVKVKVQKSKVAKAVPILTYHRISTDAGKRKYRRGDSLAVSATSFNRQMKWLKENGYTTVSTEELREWRVEGAFLPKKSVLVTMDDGFFETYYVALPILKKYNQKAVSFLIGEAVRVKTKKFKESRAWEFVGRDVIKKVRKEYPNLEFQSHTYDMHHRAASGMGVVTTWSYGQIRRDFKRNKEFGFTALAYPYGHTSSNMYAALRADKDINIAFGYIMDWPATRRSPIYNMPRFKVMGDGSLYDFIKIVRTAR